MFSRRTFLALCGAGAAAATGAIVWHRRRPAQRQQDVDDAVNVLCRASSSDVLAKTASLLREGYTPEALLTAAYLLPVLTGGDAADVHASMVVPAVRALVDGVRGSEGLLPVMWAVENAHEWSRTDRVSPDIESVRHPEDALSDALRQQDVPLADRAIATLVREAGPRKALQRLCFEATTPRDDPHCAIYAAQISRMADLLAVEHMTAAIRSGARYLARRSTLEPAEQAAIDMAQDWHGLAALTLNARLADDSESGLGVHQVTLFDALARCHDICAPPYRQLVLQRAAQWLHGRWTPRTLHQRPLPSRLSALREAARRKVLLGGASPHDFKYLVAAEALISRVHGAVAASCHQLLLPEVFPIRSTWKHREQAVELLVSSTS